MTLSDFRAQAGHLLRGNHLYAGTNYLIDHNDGSVYNCIVWANGGMVVSTDQVFTREHRDYKKTYERAVSNPQTIHFQRREPWLM